MAGCYFAADFLWSGMTLQRKTIKCLALYGNTDDGHSTTSSGRRDCLALCASTISARAHYLAGSPLEQLPAGTPYGNADRRLYPRDWRAGPFTPTAGAEDVCPDRKRSRHADSIPGRSAAKGTG